VRRYTLRTASVLSFESAPDEARRLRSMDDAIGAEPAIVGLDLYEARDAMVGHYWRLEAAKAEHRRASRVALSRAARARKPGEWPPFDDIESWQQLGASHALLWTYPRILTTDQRPHALAYTAVYEAVMEAYMSNEEPSMDEAITSSNDPNRMDRGEYGDPQCLAWSAEIGKIAAAYARAQASMGALVASHKAKIKTNKGADFEYSFANIADALKACLGAFNAEGCAILQPITTFKGGVEVRTIVIHESGQWLRSGILVLPAHGDAQAIGSAITYARRYQILGMVGLAPSDDDGATATASVRSSSGHDYEHRASSGPVPKKADAIGARCSGAKWPGDLGREVHQLAQDLATLSGSDPMDIWWDLLPDAGVDQQPYMDTDGAWPAHARVLSTTDGKLVKAAALKKLEDARRP
jgi:hypothetical protein